MRRHSLLLCTTSWTSHWNTPPMIMIIWCNAWINPLQQELSVSTPASSRCGIIPYFHRVAPSAVNRRRWRWKRYSPGCFWGGRSDREGGRSEDSSGDPPRRSTLSCIPEHTAEKTMSQIQTRHLICYPSALRPRKEINKSIYKITTGI